MTDLSSMVLSILDARRGSLTLTRHIADVPWIRETEPARTVMCPECDWMHEEEPIARPGAGGEVHLYIPCPEAGRVEIDPSQLRLWIIDLARLAEEIARLIGMTGRVLELHSDRLWRLGRTRWKQTSRDVLFARGLHWPDAEDVIAGVERMTQPVVLVPDQMPDDRLLGHRVSIVPLSHVSQLSHDGLEIDHQHLFAMVADQQERLVVSDSESVSGRTEKLMVRRQVKAEIQTMLADDALVAAYAEHGSYRKAADALSEQTGQLISKDKVSRAVQRRGGPRSVRSETNSDSVRRTVASQRCDSRKKIQNRPEAFDWE